jgi:NAD(P)-dependent dehydrogenase (short-subunit alcohol dehydrogenase family)
MQSRYADKTVIVTGAASGIGLAITERCLAEGAVVVANDRDESKLAKLAGPRVHARAGDVADPDLAEDLVHLATSVGTGRIDGLFNNAGATAVGPPEDLPMAEWRRVIGVNLDAAFQLAQAVGRVMIAQGGGAILNIASAGGIVALSNRVAYVASKHGLIGMTRALAVDWGPHNVRVNALCPGLTATAMNAQRRVADDGAWFAAREAITPLRRASRPEDQAAYALFLNSDDAAFISGDVAVADGGQHALYSGHVIDYGGLRVVR